MLAAFFFWLFSLKQLVFLQWVLPALILVVFGLTMNATITLVGYTTQIHNRYYGLTPDWENYCKASEWASKNLSKDAVIACRKPSISFIYGNGRRFFGISAIKSYTGNSLLKFWQEKGSNFYLISANALEQKSFPEELFEVLRNSIVAFATNFAFGTDKEVFKFYIMNFPDSLKDRIDKDLNTLQVNHTHNIDSLKVYLNNPKQNIKVIYPDSLLNILKNANVTHVLEASLRRQSSVKNGQLINTVERFMIYVRIKYPKLLTRVIQFGEDDNEPAWIYQVNYK